MKQLVSIALIAVFLIGCTTFYQSVVTLTAVVDSAMKQWAALSVAGKTSPAIDVRVSQAHTAYRQAAATAQEALIQYKATGDQGAYIAALNAAKVAAQGLIDLIVPLLNPVDASTLQSNLAKAKTL
jgi:hypothetical protein